MKSSIRSIWLRGAILSLALGAAAGCNKTDGTVDLGPPPGSPSSTAGAGGSAAPAKKDGTFSNDLVAELNSTGDAAKAGSGSGKPAAATTPAAAATTPAATTPAAAATTPATPPVAAATPAATTTPPSTTPAAATRPADAKPAVADSKPAAATTPVATTPAAASTTPAVATPPDAAAAPVAGAKPPGPVKLTPELAAIKLSLLPNWDRDIDGGGTFQYVVRIKGTQSTKTFTFYYGYDDPRAPADRDQYKKFVQTAGILTGELKDRQRGAAWMLEGADATGMPSFRYVVLYGGKRLVCYGPTYKDADSNRLGDDRDQTVIQAKQICESISL